MHLTYAVDDLAEGHWTSSWPQSVDMAKDSSNRRALRIAFSDITEINSQFASKFAILGDEAPIVDLDGSGATFGLSIDDGR